MTKKRRFGEKLRESLGPDSASECQSSKSKFSSHPCGPKGSVQWGMSLSRRADNSNHSPRVSVLGAPAGKTDCDLLWAQLPFTQTQES